MGWFNPKVEVTFIDDATGQSFAVTQMPPANLPESFELDTTFHLGDEDWTVVDAQPKTRAEYRESRTLTLRLRRVEQIDPNKILFSLSSICDAIPGVCDQPLSGDELLLAEDDWRQFEFVSRSLAHMVDEEIAKIRLIHENAAAEAGWREIHVRTRPEIPIGCSLELAALAKALGASAKSAGITYRGAQSQIIDGYSLTTNDGASVYGVAPNGNVQVIAFGQDSDASPNAESIDRLGALARDLKLDLVNWCRCVRVGPEDSSFGALLSDDGT